MMPVLERQIAGMLRDHFEIVAGSNGSVTVLHLTPAHYWNKCDSRLLYIGKAQSLSL